MQKQVKKLYEAPDLTMVSFQVEKGFSVSDPFLAFTLGGWDGDNRHNDQNVTRFSHGRVLCYIVKVETAERKKRRTGISAATISWEPRKIKKKTRGKENYFSEILMNCQ